MKIFYSFHSGLLCLLFCTTSLMGQKIISQDNASNYSSGEWVNGSNKGSGFTPWIMWTQGSGYAGHFISGSVSDGFGDVDTGGQAFGMYANPNSGNPQANTFRYFRGTGSVADPGDGRSYLLPGQVFSIELAVAYRNGYKGIDITTDDGSFRLATFAVDGNTYRFGTIDDGTFYDVGSTFSYNQASVFKVEAYQVTDNTYRVTLTRGTTTVDTGLKTGQIGGFKIYESSTDSGNALNNIYFNKLKIERRCPTVTVWNGNNWSNGTPDLTKQAYIEADLDITENLNTCTLYVTGMAQVTVQAGINLTVANEVNVADSATLILENNANLIQIDNVQNTGNIIVKRNSSAIKRLDYTAWGSPVAGQNLFGFSPNTLPNRFYSYSTETNSYSQIQGLSAESTTEFEIAKGYLIRVPNTHPETPTVWSGEFTGIPNNGTITIPLVTASETQNRYNLIANPYPSPISVETFIARNSNAITGELWFWRKTNNPNSSSYCTVTTAGYVGNADLENFEDYDPNGIIRTGQGFFVKTLSASPANLIFNNSMREPDTANQFFRASTQQTQHNRYWLAVANENQMFNQILVNYMPRATNGLDYGIDGRAMTEGNAALYTVINDTKLAIQGRALPFAETDVVPLGFKSDTEGIFTISLYKAEGFFAHEQDILLKDNATGAIHNLKDSDYSFTTAAGIFNSRFEIIYTQQLLTIDNPNNTNNTIKVFQQGKAVHINSALNPITEVTVYDINGRMLYSAKNLNENNVEIENLSLARQVAIVQVRTVDNVIFKKIIIQ